MSKNLYRQQILCVDLLSMMRIVDDNSRCSISRMYLIECVNEALLDLMIFSKVK